MVKNTAPSQVRELEGTNKLNILSLIIDIEQLFTNELLITIGL